MLVTIAHWLVSSCFNPRVEGSNPDCSTLLLSKFTFYIGSFLRKSSKWGGNYFPALAGGEGMSQSGQTLINLIPYMLYFVKETLTM